MNVVIMGSQGMLGKAFVRSSGHGFNVIEASRDNFDFTIKNKLYEFLDIENPHVIINAAANINMLYCEEHASDTLKINVEFVQNLAEWCAINNALLVQISTDHFYDYGGRLAHNEIDEIKILNEYARQKYLAEKIATQTCKSLILRTSILGYRYSGKSTFIEWILKTIKTESSISGFVNAYTSAIDVDSFVDIVFSCVDARLTGCFNIGCAEVYSKYDLIKGVIAQLGNADIILTSANVSELYPKRASCCGLDSKKIEDEMGISLPTLDMVIENLKTQENYNAI
jgi:dTDP-4-dehydrorhamnose reductase